MSLTQMIAGYGSALVAGLVALECVGIPLPGETVLIAAAVYAGTTHELRIEEVIFAAIIGAICGNLAGFVLGRELGYRLLLRHGGYIGLTEPRIKIGQYLFLHHGTKVVVIARFVAVLRSVGGVLAGANHMPWRPFLVANAIGAVAWACLFGLGGYYLGDHAVALAGPVGLVLAVMVVVAMAVGAMLFARHEQRLTAAAERAFPGPLRAPR